jgi:excisionase family DNA binding protein
MRERIYSSHEVGTLLQANPSTVIRWIDQGQLKAYRTPGGHRRVRKRDLLAFLKSYDMPIPAELTAVEAPRFLLVDDDPKFLKALRRGLAKHFSGSEIDTSTNGIEALLKIGTLRPDVVVLDIYMPEVDGIEVCRKIKENEETADVEVVGMTGRPSAEVERKIREAGAKALLTKPFTASQLANALGR